jgi:hypothetical protein
MKLETVEVSFGSFADIRRALTGCPLYPLKADIGVTHRQVSFGPTAAIPQTHIVCGARLNFTEHAKVE